MSATVKASSEHGILTYRKLRPSPPLTEYVRGYHYAESFAGEERSAHPFAVSVFPLVCFYLRAQCQAFEYAPGQTRLLPPVIAVGPCDHRVADVLSAGHLMHFSIVFQPTGFFRLFRISPWEVRNRAYDCRDVLGQRMAGLFHRLCEATCPEQMVVAVEEVLLDACASASPPSGVFSAAETLLHSKGRADLLSVADSFGLSDSSWRRHFSAEIGVTPKRYSRMLRFRHAFALKRASGDASWTQVCLDAGYYDQAHFITECQALVGCAPSKFIRELAAIPEALASAWYGPAIGPIERKSQSRAGAVFARRG